MGIHNKDPYFPPILSTDWQIKIRFQNQYTKLKKVIQAIKEHNELQKWPCINLQKSLDFRESWKKKENLKL